MLSTALLTSDQKIWQIAHHFGHHLLTWQAKLLKKKKKHRTRGKRNQNVLQPFSSLRPPYPWISSTSFISSRQLLFQFLYFHLTLNQKSPPLINRAHHRAPNPCPKATMNRKITTLSSHISLANHPITAVTTISNPCEPRIKHPKVSCFRNPQNRQPLLTHSHHEQLLAPPSSASSPTKHRHKVALANPFLLPLNRSP
ncbi:hypothetical protein I3760_01G205200 [Carya illinoinensis]|nr:hypothetical protein I3760_01G205200 [Carya illinoinensis]